MATDLVTALLPELVLAVLERLDATHLARSRGVSRAWNCLCGHDRLWYRLAANSELWYAQKPPPFILGHPPPRGIGSQEVASAGGREFNQLTPTSTSIHDASSSQTPEWTWRSMLTRQLCIERNWSSGRFTMNCTLSKHLDVVLAVRICGNLVLSGSRSRRIHVAQINSDSVVQVLDDHDRAVSCIEWWPEATVFVSGSWDGTIKIWSLSACGLVQLKETLCARDPVICLKVKDGLVVCGTENGQIHGWAGLDVSMAGDGGMRIAFVLDCGNHSGSDSSDTDQLIGCVDFDDLHVYAGVGSWLCVWDRPRQIDSDNRRRMPCWSARVHSGRITSVRVHGRLLLTASEDGTASVFDIYNRDRASNHNTVVLNSADTPLHEKFRLVGHTAGVRCLTSRANKLITGSYDGTLRLWSLEDGHCIAVMSGHSGDVNAVDCDGSRVVSGADDKQVLIWDFEHVSNPLPPQTENSKELSNAFSVSDDKINHKKRTGAAAATILKRSNLIPPLRRSDRLKLPRLIQ